MLATTLLPLVLASCDPLVEEGFQGDVLFSTEGRVVDFTLNGAELTEPLASLFWTSSGDTTISPNLLSAQSAVAVQVAFPATFRINVFDAPVVARSGERPFAIGEIVVWQDDNNDGSYDADEFRGAALDHVILYADHDVPATESPTGRVLPAGFSQVSIPLPCEPLSVVPATDDCGVPLGAACNVGGGQCGVEGQCMLDDGYTSYPDGYCVLSYDSPCTPNGGVLLGVDNGSFFEDVWIKGCYSAEDCRDGYSCEYWLNGCLPDEPLAITIDDTFQLQPLCFDDLEFPKLWSSRFQQ